MAKVKHIQVKDRFVVMAGIAINLFLIRKKLAPTTQLVLAEIIARSENGLIEDPAGTGIMIQHDLKITPEHYRQAIAKLKAMDLITRNKENMIALNLIIAGSFETIKITEK